MFTENSILFYYVDKMFNIISNVLLLVVITLLFLTFIKIVIFLFMVTRTMIIYMILKSIFFNNGCQNQLCKEELMKLLEMKRAYLYENEKAASGTITAYRKVIDDFCNWVGSDVLVDDAFEPHNIRGFILKGQADPVRKFNAITSFYNYICVEQGKSRDLLSLFETLRIESGAKKPKTDKQQNRVYIPRDKGLDIFFDDKHYRHLKSYEASIFIKACVALFLSGCYESSYILNPNPIRAKIEDSMQMSDCIINNKVLIRNDLNPNVPWIEVQGKCAEILKEYYEVRSKKIITQSGQSNLFIAQIWDSSKVSYNPEYYSSKKAKSSPAYSVISLFSYMLRFISHMENIKVLQPKDLKFNAILHSLYNSQGKSFFDLVTIFGMDSFLVTAYEQYRDELDVESAVIDPFSNAPLSSIIDKGALTNEDIIDCSQHLINKRIRDRPIVQELKSDYNNHCQICGEALVLYKGISYSEVHHIHPLGNPHLGSDEKGNMVVVCPNHHELFDFGVIAIDPKDSCTLLHLDHSHPLHNQKLKYCKHELFKEHLKYHYNNIFLPLHEKYTR